MYDVTPWLNTAYKVEVLLKAPNNFMYFYLFCFIHFTFLLIVIFLYFLYIVFSSGSSVTLSLSLYLPPPPAPGSHCLSAISQGEPSVSHLMSLPPRGSLIQGTRNG